MFEQPQAYTVSAITRLIKTTLEESFCDIWVEGEISNYHHHSSGHRYFSLKDDNAVLRVTLWRSLGAYLKFEPEDGQKVLIYGDISVYERGGQYQLNCKKIVPVGVGELELAFRQLFEKLSAEGLFDEDRKKPIPMYPLKVGIVTSLTGAAIRDIIQIATRRNPSVELVVYPAQVQGEGAERTIAAGIEYFNTRDDIDVIITGRGGGSLEDLWPFNTEVTVRAIVASENPVVSAVGHEVDTTLSDLAADLRAPTPSAAAELVIWSREEYLQTVRSMLQQQARLLHNQLRHARLQLRALTSRSSLARPLQMVYQRQQFLDQQVRLLINAGKNSFEKNKNGLSLLLSRLETLSPLKVLARGYSVTLRMPDKRLVKSVEDVEIGNELETILNHGKIQSRVENLTAEGYDSKKRP